MVAPKTWTFGTAVATDGTYLTPVTHHGGSFILTDLTFDGVVSDQINVWHATDPTGAWTLTTPFTAGTADIIETTNASVEFDGTYYATCMGGWVSGDSYYGAHVLYASSLGGTWTRSLIADGTFTSVVYDPSWLAYGNGDWAVVGTKRDDPTITAFLSYTSDVTGAWTTIGNVTGVTGDRGRRIAYGGGTWVMVVQDASNYLKVYTASAPASTWTECASFPANMAVGAAFWLGPVKYLNGYYCFAAQYTTDGGPTQNRIFYATDPAGTWSTVTESTMGVYLADNEYLSDIDYAAKAWILNVITPFSDVANIRYLQTTGSPAGAYTSATGVSFKGGGGIGHSSKYVVASQMGVGGGIAWSGIPASTLRQRQSPRRSPSRVGWY